MDEIERLRKKLESYPSPSAYSRLAELIRLNGDLDEAAALCQRCIAEFPRNGQAYVILAGIHLSRGQRDTAKETLITGTRQDQRSYSGLRMLSDLHADDGNLGAAIACLEQILSFKRQDDSVRQRLQHLQQRRRSATSTSGRPVTHRVVRGDGSGADRDAVDLSAAPRALTSSAGAGPADEVDAGPAPSAEALDILCSEPGVHGAVIVDRAGRVVVDRGLDAEGELLAALAHDITVSGRNALRAIGGDDLQSWAIATAKRQILAFRRDGDLTLITEADASCKLALLELRARQALIDLGAEA
ncbi:MAG: tetratricopeptide repeat protein [Planctomycetota bacterium]